MTTKEFWYEFGYTYMTLVQYEYDNEAEMTLLIGSLEALIQFFDGEVS